MVVDYIVFYFYFKIYRIYNRTKPPYNPTNHPITPPKSFKELALRMHPKTITSISHPTNNPSDPLSLPPYAQSPPHSLTTADSWTRSR